MSGPTYDQNLRLSRVLVEEFPRSAINFLATKFLRDELESEVKQCCTRDGQNVAQVLARQHEGDDPIVGLARILIEDFPRSAMNFLATKFGKEDIEREIRECCTRDGEDFAAVLLRPRHALDLRAPTVYSPVPTAPESVASTHIPRPATFMSGFASSEPHLISGSIISHTKRSGPEIIIVFDVEFQGQPLSLIRAPIKHNWIRADIVHEHLRLPVTPCEEPGVVSEQYPQASSGMLHATHETVLTWRRKDSNSTERATYLLSDEPFGADIVLADASSKYSRKRPLALP